jgi:hypothetical protein
VTIEWREPPDKLRGGGNGIWFATLEPLMHHPGRWAMVRKCSEKQQAAMLASNLRHGRLRSPGVISEWEFVARGYEVFARYVGKAKS